MKSRKHISDKSGFKVPETYFEDFEIKLLNSEKQKNKSGFTVPKGYFENFEISKHKSTKVIRLTEIQKTLGVAATLLILLGTLLFGLFFNPKPEQKPLDFSKLNRAEMMNYLEDEMMMDYDLYLENENIELNHPGNHIDNANIIDNMDDSSIEQLMDY